MELEIPEIILSSHSRYLFSSQTILINYSEPDAFEWLINEIDHETLHHILSNLIGRDISNNFDRHLIPDKDYSRFYTLQSFTHIGFGNTTEYLDSLSKVKPSILPWMW